MLSEQTLEEALGEIGVQAPVRFDEVTGSTQVTAAKMAEAGVPEWTLVAAGHQTAGRGRLGRTWVDEPGRALLFSLVLRPELPPERGGLITLLAGAAIAEASRETAGVEAMCKWPNDILVAGRKAGGILAESKITSGDLEHVVLGVGLNLGDTPADIPGAVALDDVQPGALLRAFLHSFRAGYEPTRFDFSTTVRSLYRKVSATLGRNVRATTVTGTMVEGRAVDLDDDGALLVETVTGLDRVAFGEIEHLGS